MAGGVVTTMNPLYTAEEVHRQLADSGATVLVTVPPFLETAAEGAKGTQVRELFVFGEAEGRRRSRRSWRRVIRPQWPWTRARI